MRRAVMGSWTAAAVLIVSGATLLAPSRSQAAVPLALTTAAEQTTLTQTVNYVCRRGAHGRECYYVSPPNRSVRYSRPYASPSYRAWGYPSYDDLKYDYHHWGGGDAPD